MEQILHLDVPLVSLAIRAVVVYLSITGKNSLVHEEKE